MVLFSHVSVRRNDSRRAPGSVTSIYPAAQNLLLAARNEGLGCVLTTLLCMEEPAVKKLLDIPADWHTAAHVPLGYPVLGGHGPISRREPAQMIYRDRFGQSTY